MSKVALVSGSSKGIGKGIARILAGSGYVVYINGRNTADVSKTAHELGKNAIELCQDLSSERGVDDALNLIQKEQGQIDLVVANIGSGKSMGGWNVPLEEYKRMFDVNFFNSVLLLTKSISYMEQGGHIVAISSIAGCEALVGPPIPYTTAKSALISFVKSISKVVGEKGIRANTVSPGNVMFLGSTWENKINQNKEAVNDYIRNNVPLNGFASPEDIGRAVLFLDQNLFITGDNLIVDGGQINKII